MKQLSAWKAGDQLYVKIVEKIDEINAARAQIALGSNAILAANNAICQLEEVIKSYKLPFTPQCVKKI